MRWPRPNHWRFRDDNGRRVAVLDLIVEVPVTYVPPLEQETRALRFGWWVRSLITVSVLEKPEGDESYRQISRPVFLDTGGIDGRQARLRREIDRLKTCRERYNKLVTQAVEAQTNLGTPLPTHFEGWQEQVQGYEAHIRQCCKT